ncbi:MAG: divalent-cation tolerance protein CutA [Magnetococcales bacterium]|nr:divalent-cation tolerance protein CutA [Magnetococcales bacterium]
MEQAPTLWLVWSNAPSEAIAQQLAHTLLAERLVACAHLFPGGRSIYHWQGQLEESVEWTLMFKTTAERYPAMVERLRGLHPHETPEILATPVVAADPRYAAWVIESTAPLPVTPEDARSGAHG